MSGIESGNDVLCGANSYEEKFYFNPKFERIPEDVRKELQAMTVLFTEECGGILTLEYLRDGTLIFRTMADDYDYYYDEIEAGLAIRKIQTEKKELLEALELFYRTFFCEKDAKPDEK